MWWLPAASMLALGLMIYVTSAAHVLNFSPLTVARNAADRAEQRAVGEARATTPSTDRNQAVRTIQLRAGDQAGAATFEIPIPPDAHATGGLGRGGGSTGESRDRALLGTYGEIPDVLTFYRRELSSRGWHEVRSWLSRPTDGVAGPAGAVSVFCHGADLPSLMVGVVTTEDGVSELRLLVDSEQPGACASTPPTDPWSGPDAPVY